MTSTLTVAPSTWGPTLTSSPASMSTGSSSSVPASASSFSTRSTSPSATRYYLPPVLTLANIFPPPGASALRGGGPHSSQDETDATPAERARLPEGGL